MRNKDPLLYMYIKGPLEVRIPSKPYEIHTLNVTIRNIQKINFYDPLLVLAQKESDSSSIILEWRNYAYPDGWFKRVLGNSDWSLYYYNIKKDLAQGVMIIKPVKFLVRSKAKQGIYLLRFSVGGYTDREHTPDTWIYTQWIDWKITLKDSLHL